MNWKQTEFNLPGIPSNLTAKVGRPQEWITLTAVTNNLIHLLKGKIRLYTVSNTRV